MKGDKEQKLIEKLERKKAKLEGELLSIQHQLEKAYRRVELP